MPDLIAFFTIRVPGQAEAAGATAFGVGSARTAAVRATGDALAGAATAAAPGSATASAVTSVRARRPHVLCSVLIMSPPGLFRSLCVRVARPATVGTRPRDRSRPDDGRQWARAALR
nr:hypothetical protein GCM10025730_26910 [Promicromonospora thailandica]